MENGVKNKHGMQLAVESFEQILPRTIEGIRGYLASGMIKRDRTKDCGADYRSVWSTNL